jgi:hypothetical protein
MKIFMNHCIGMNYRAGDTGPVFAVTLTGTNIDLPIVVTTL